ncbi:co-chaperone DjlA [Tahibacter caeni]|uniref:co-chaperone DjlA n=1 Tax=Tahibacter caeni TaxID=1453545 RepID=UPI0021486C67|nr:co-chaperone DjlA [Tahibacter caeni]
MNWLGKAVGAVLGLVLVRHPLGALFGALVGHLFDIGLFAWQRTSPSSGHSSFFDLLFAFAGAMAKADGRVSEREIAVVEQLMQRMSLTVDQRREAIARFNDGKTPGFDVERTIRGLRAWCLGRRDHAYVLIDVVLDVVFADGAGRERLQLMRRLCAALGVHEREVAVLAAMKGYAWDLYDGGSARAPPPRQSGGPDPYAVLGVERGADEREVKRAWRKLMSEHHPDKLGDVPEALRERAEQRAREINTAYERIRGERGFR